MKITLHYFLTVLLYTAVCAQVLADVPELQSDSELASAGYFRLSWQGEDHRDYVLQQANNPEFLNPQTLYQGPDTATLVSGRSDGSYYYRIRYVEADGWSNVTKVEVSHHSLSRAFMFFSLGAIVFIITLVVVVIGNKTHKNLSR